MRTLRQVALAVLLASMAVPAKAGSPSGPDTPTITIRPSTAAAITLDGKLDEAVWRSAPVVHLVQQSLGRLCDRHRPERDGQVPALGRLAAGDGTHQEFRLGLAEDGQIVVDMAKVYRGELDDNSKNWLAPDAVLKV